MADKYLLCVAQRHDNQWEAICLDLDLAVQGCGFDEVRDRLHDAILTYVEDAMKEPVAIRDQLLHRRAPLSARVVWLWPFVLATIFGRKRDGHDDAVGFPVACPA